MYWLVAGLLVLGAACGAMFRLVIFVGVLAVSAVIATAAGIFEGFGAAALTAVVTVVALQIGYVVGFVLRAVVRSQQAANAARSRHEESVAAPFGEKRQ